MMQAVRANDGRNGSDVWRRCRGGSHEATERPRDPYYIMPLNNAFVVFLRFASAPHCHKAKSE